MTAPGTKEETPKDIKGPKYEVIYDHGTTLDADEILANSMCDEIDLMNIILVTLESDTFDNFADNVKSCLSLMVKRALRENITLNYVSIDVTSVIGDIPSAEKDTKNLSIAAKCVHKVTYNHGIIVIDTFTVSWSFSIRRKQMLDSLKEAALRRVSQLLGCHDPLLGEDLEKIQIPLVLKGEMLNEYFTIWCQTRGSKCLQITFEEMEASKHFDLCLLKMAEGGSAHYSSYGWKILPKQRWTQRSR